MKQASFNLSNALVKEIMLIKKGGAIPLIRYSGKFDAKGNLKSSLARVVNPNKPQSHDMAHSMGLRIYSGIQGTNLILRRVHLRFCFDVRSCLDIPLNHFQAERNCIPLDIIKVNRIVKLRTQL